MLLAMVLEEEGFEKDVSVFYSVFRVIMEAVSYAKLYEIYFVQRIKCAKFREISRTIFMRLPQIFLVYYVATKILRKLIQLKLSIEDTVWPWRMKLSEILLEVGPSAARGA